MEREYESSSDRIGKGVGAIALGIFLIFCAFKYGHLESKNYIETLYTFKKVLFGINSKSYDMVIEFEYEFNEKTYTSEKFSDQKTFTSPDD